MPARTSLRFDEIGYWSEVKLDIVREYAQAYSRILAAQPKLKHVYIDAFSGAGKHISRRTGDFVLGSPLNALSVRPAFSEFHFIDLNPEKMEFLENEVGERPDVFFHRGDCNQTFLREIVPRIRWENFRRALCLLDPYGLHLDWSVIETAGKLRSVEIFLNFPVADMNRNVFWRNPEGVAKSDIERMTRFWGDESWRDAAYDKSRDLFEFPERTDNETVMAAYRDRLISVAQFKFVPEPIPMRNSTGAIVYYLFFASQNRAGQKIVTDIFDKYRHRGRR